MITIHVLAGGELFQHVLNAISAFVKQDSFGGSFANYRVNWNRQYGHHWVY